MSELLRPEMRGRQVHRRVGGTTTSVLEAEIHPLARMNLGHELEVLLKPMRSIQGRDHEDTSTYSSRFF